MPRIPLPETNQLPQGMLQVRAADTTAVGRAMMGFGESIAGLGAAFGAMAKKQEQEKEQQDRVTVQKALVDERLTQMQTMGKAQTDAPLGAPNFTKDYLGNFEKRRAELDKQYADLSPKAREALDLGLAGLRNDLAGDAMRFEGQSAGQKAKMDALDTQQKLGQIAGMNPTEEGFNTAMKEWDATVDAMPNIDAATRESIRRNGRDQISLAAAQAWVDANPEEAKRALTPQVGSVPAGPQALLNVIAGVESPGYNVMYGGARFSSYDDHPRKAVPIASGPNKGKTSSAAGRYQFLGSTWDRAAKALGLTDFSPANQDKAAWWLAQEDYKARTGRNLNEDLASGQNMGAIRKALAPTWEGLQFISDEEFARRMQKQGGAVKVTDGQTGVPQLDAIPQDKRNALLNRAETKINQDAQQYRADLEPLVQNANAAYMSTGEYSGPPITQEMFQRAYPEDWQRRYEQFQTTAQTGETIAEFKTLPVGEITSRVEAMKPETSDPMYADKFKAYEIAQAAAKQVLEARQKDPAAYIAQMFPDVNSKADATAEAGIDAETLRARYQAQYASMDAAYQQIGMPNDQRFLLTNAQVEQAIDRVNDTTVPASDRMAVVQQLLASTTDNDQRRRIFEQLVQKDASLAPLQSAIDAWERGDEGAARRLFSAGLLDPDKIQKMPGGINETEIAAAVDEQMLGPGSIGDAKYGVASGVLENGETLRRDRTLAMNAVKQNLMMGMSLSDAVALTMKDINGPVQVISSDSVFAAALTTPRRGNPNTGTTFGFDVMAVVPEGVDQTQFLNGVARVAPMFKAEMMGRIPAEPPPDVPAAAIPMWKMQRERDVRYVEHIMDEGQFRQIGDGYGLFDPNTGRFVPGPSGEPLTFTLDQIMGSR